MRTGIHDFARACLAASDAVQEVGSRDLKSIPSISLDEVIGDQMLEIRLPIQRYVDGMLPTHQALILLSIAVANEPSAVLEIGTLMGHTTKAMALNLPNSIIHTVDLPLDFAPERDPVTNLPKDDFHLIAARQVGREFRGTPLESRIRQHFGDTATWDFSQAKGVNFFFIDGSHTYEYCKSDSEKCWDLCDGKGVFIWHDCNDDHPGVVKFVREWRAKGRDIVRINGTCVAYLKNV